MAGAPGALVNLYCGNAECRWAGYISSFKGNPNYRQSEAYQKLDRLAMEGKSIPQIMSETNSVLVTAERSLPRSPPGSNGQCRCDHCRVKGQK